MSCHVLVIIIPLIINLVINPILVILIFNVSFKVKSFHIVSCTHTTFIDNVQR